MDLFDQANALNAAGKFTEAEEIYDLILTQNHDNAGLLATVGTMYLRMNKPGLAMALLQTAAEKYKKIPSDVLCNIGMAYKYSGQYDKAVKYMKRAAENDPSAETLANYGGMYIESGDPKDAIKIFKRALAMNPQLAIAHWNMAISLLEDGQWDKAWDEYEWGFESKQRIERKLGNKPRWDGTPGKTVAVYGEQGIGDEIMFASMIPDLLKTNNVILECHKRLVTTFQKAFPGIKVYGTREDTNVPWVDNEQFDYQCSIGSLGKFYRRSRESFPGTPFLNAEPLPRSDKFRVGISWTGGLKAGRVRKRTVPLSWWRSILKNDCEFVSLQYTDCDEELNFMEKFGYEISRPPEAKADDYYETARLVQSCDLVISVCTSVIHLAGALGVPCWVMTPKNPAWRYQNTGGMPWYRSVRLYRQINPDDWRPVIERVGFDLSEMLGNQERKSA